MSHDAIDGGLESTTEDPYPWQAMFLGCDSCYHGYVSDVDAAYDLIAEFSSSTHTSYVKVKATEKFGKYDYSG
jgi:hypothetical protein